jgi:hypothetical protein
MIGHSNPPTEGSKGGICGTIGRRTEELGEPSNKEVLTMISSEFGRRTLVVVVATIGQVLWVPQFTDVGTKAQSQREEARKCSITITSPVPGASVREVSIVEGKAKIPANGHLWVLAHPGALNGWWPQGGGEIPLSEGKWAVDVQYGVERDKGKFEIAVVAVDKAVNSSLENWVETAPDRNYPPVRFPQGIEGCPIAKVTVVK